MNKEGLHIKLKAIKERHAYEVEWSMVLTTQEL